MGKAETTLTKKMRDAGRAKYGDRLVTVKYPGDVMGEAGVSDILGCLDGVFFACEVKSPDSSQHKRATLAASILHALTKGPTLKQRIFLSRIARAGGVWSVAATVEQFLETLEAAEFQARGNLKVLPWMVNVEPICTCSEEQGCEFETDDGCLHCRTAPVTEPCPNLDR